MFCFDHPAILECRRLVCFEKEWFTVVVYSSFRIIGTTDHRRESLASIKQFDHGETFYSTVRTGPEIY
jgi:hypothetical protein